MLILILDFFKARIPDGDIGWLRMLDYISVRTAMAMAIAFLTSLILGPSFITWLERLKAGQVIRKAYNDQAIDLAAMHGKKAGTPSMGGLIMIIALTLPVMLFCRLNNPLVLLITLMTYGYGALGFIDDYTKISQQNHKGVSPKGKLIIQGLLAVILAFGLLYLHDSVRYTITGDEGYAYLLVPFDKNIYISLGFWFIPFVMLVMMCTSNAVNLTDGLDGLAIGVSIANIAAFLIISYLASNANYAPYLFIPHVPGGGELTVFLGALLGASLGFLWFNAHPAQVFMGDTGSMMLGGALGTTAIMLKMEILLIVIGGVFVMEALSVILQVSTFKLTGTRFFRMSPLHHHFEKRGLAESKIIIRFWLISWLLALAGLAMLKIR